MLPELMPGPASAEPADLVAAGGLAFLRAVAPGLGFELWKSDGTAAGTALVRDVAPGPISGVGQFSLAALGDGRRVVFAGDDGIRGQEVWVSDGTAAGTVAVGDAVPGPAGCPGATR